MKSALVSEQTCKGRSRPVHMTCIELQKNNSLFNFKTILGEERFYVLDKMNGQ